MRYKRSRTVALIGLVVVAVPLVAFVTLRNLDRLQEWYVDRTVHECAASTELGQVQWVDVMAFDAHVKEFRPGSEAGFATFDCIARKAGWALDWQEDSRFAQPMMQVSVSGSNYAPPKRIYNVGMVRRIEAPRP